MGTFFVPPTLTPRSKAMWTSSRSREIRAIPEYSRRASEGRASEGRAPEGRAPEGRAPEGRAPEGRAPEGRAPEGRARRPSRHREPANLTAPAAGRLVGYS
jgi:hypothetical protein